MGGGTGLMVLGGLLQGVGKGIENENEARRQEALLNLKHQFDVEQNTADNAAAQKRIETQVQGRIDAINATGDVNQQTEKVKGEVDQANIRLTKSLDYSNDKNLKAIQQKYDLNKIQAQSVADTARDAKKAHIEVDHYEIAANGQIVIWKKDGTAFTRGADGSFVPRKSADDDSLDIPGMTGATASSSAAPAPAKAPANDQIKGQALARLPGLYAQAQQNPQAFKQQYPGFFDANGNLRPIDELRQQVVDRYGG